jgi:hypothetical protein
MKHRSAESIAGRYTIEAGQRSDKEREMEAPTASLSRRKYFVGLLAAAAASQENELKSRRPKAQRRVPAFFGGWTASCSFSGRAGLWVMGAIGGHRARP